MRLVIFGPPGAGKGTLAKSLESLLGVPHIDMGSMLREEIKNQTDIGKKIAEYVNQGKLVPDEMVLEVLRRRLNPSGYLLDGFPRNLRQAEILNEISRPDIVINLVVSEETVVRRLSSRRVCISCGAIYNLLSAPPKTEEKCDVCGGRLIRRTDDEPATILERLKVYREQTQPVLDFYRRLGVLVDVDGNGSREEVLEEVRRVLEERGIIRYT